MTRMSETVDFVSCVLQIVTVTTYLLITDQSWVFPSRRISTTSCRTYGCCCCLSLVSLMRCYYGVYYIQQIEYFYCRTFPLPTVMICVQCQIHHYLLLFQLLSFSSRLIIDRLNLSQALALILLLLTLWVLVG